MRKTPRDLNPKKAKQKKRLLHKQEPQRAVKTGFTSEQDKTKKSTSACGAPPTATTNSLPLQQETLTPF